MKWKCLTEKPRHVGGVSVEPLLTHHKTLFGVSFDLFSASHVGAGTSLVGVSVKLLMACYAEAERGLVGISVELLSVRHEDAETDLVGICIKFLLAQPHQHLHQASLHPSHGF